MLTAAALLVLLQPSAPFQPRETPPLPLLGGGGLAIECPPTAKVFCGEPIDPDALGIPVVTGACGDGSYTLVHSDAGRAPACPAVRFEEIVLRTWTATDSCGNVVSCTQQIDIVRRVVRVDVHPRSCPNPFNRNSNGLFPAAIVGEPGFDVTQIDLGSIEIWLDRCAAGPVPLQRVAFEDVVTPFYGDTAGCECHTLGQDGLLDLTLKFRSRDLRDLLDLDAFPRFSNVRLFVTGRTLDGCSFVGTDCIRVQ